MITGRVEEYERDKDKWEKPGAFTEFVKIMLQFYQEKAKLASSANATREAKQERNVLERENIKRKSAALLAWRAKYGFEPPVKRGKAHQAHQGPSVRKPQVATPAIPGPPEEEESSEYIPYG
jgi:hypothetical protein